MTADYKIPALALGAVTLTVIAAVAIAAPTLHTTRTIYRTPPTCAAAAREASTVIAHHRPYQPLIDIFTGAQTTKYTARHPFKIPDWLPPFDARSPHLAACR